jgi:hypothetical protein
MSKSKLKTITFKVDVIVQYSLKLGDYENVYFSLFTIFIFIYSILLAKFYAFPQLIMIILV